VIPGNELNEIIGRVSEILSSLDIPHHFTGGIAASFHGEPRLTQDIDLVVKLSPNSSKVDSLCRELSKSFDINEPAMRDAIQRHSIFQALDHEYFIKVDFHVGEAIPHELERSHLIELEAGLTVRMVSKEDSIISKLLWISKGSERSRRDVTMMLRNGAPIDEKYITRTADMLGIDKLWFEIRGLHKPGDMS